MVQRCFKTDEEKKEYYRLYYLKNRAKRIRKVKNYQRRHPEVKQKCNEEYYRKNKERLSAYQKEYYKKKKLLKNPLPNHDEETS
jgi:hypothetical protein